MKKKHSILLIAAVVLGSALAGFGWWRTSQRAEAVATSIPPRPNLAGLPVQLVQRVAACEELLSRNADVAVLAELGQLYQANGFTAEAVQCYRGLAQLQPNEPRWPHRMACLYARLGRLEDALLLWRRVTAVAPDYVPARLRMGDVLLKLNRPDEAATAYAAALDLDANNPFAQSGLARIDMAAGRWTSARERLEQATRASDFAIGGDLLPTVYERLGDEARANALRAREKSSGAFYDPPDPWMDEVFNDCFDAYQLTVAAGFADHRGDASEAEKLVTRALIIEPENATALYQSGLFAFRRRDFEKARQRFTTTVRVSPSFSDAWWQLIRVQMESGDDAAAERTLAEALAHCPNSPTLLSEHARRLDAAGHANEAIAAYQTALRHRPNDADALVKLALVYFRQGRDEAGIDALERALHAEPDHPVALTSLALATIRRGDENAAREWMQQVQRQTRVAPETLDMLKREFRERYHRAL